MRLALISDIHGNAVALRACLDKIARLRPDRIYFLGDAVGYLPDEGRVLEMLAGMGALCQQGNHEHYLLNPDVVGAAKEKEYRLHEARRRLTDEQVDALRTWPTRRELLADDLRLLLIHGSPASVLEGYVYPDTDLSPFRDLDHHVVLMGNTHRPFVREQGGKLFVNVGSLGLPRDHGSLASFALFDTVARACKIHRIRLDAAAMTAAYRDRASDAVLSCFQRTSDDVVGELIG